MKKHLVAKTLLAAVFDGHLYFKIVVTIISARLITNSYLSFIFFALLKKLKTGIKFSGS